MQQQQPSSPSSKYPNTRLLTGYDLSDNDFQYMNSQYSDGIISPTSANSIKNLYPSTTSTSSSSSTSPILSDRIKNQDKSKKNLMADYDDDEDDDDEDEEDQEEEDRGGDRETFGRPSELIGMRPSKLYLSVTGPPPNVHVDVNEMVTLEKPEWKLKQRCCVTTCKRRFGYGLIFTRRHHCRNCGDSVCGDHSLNYITLQHLSYSNPVRVCNTCYKSYEEAHLNFQNFYLERTSFRIFNGIK